MVYFQNLLFDLFFSYVVAFFSTFPVVIIGIWTDFHPAQEPADTEFLLMVVNKMVLV